jgi:nitronate monooxygenase
MMAGMTWATGFTELLGVRLPVALAPMGDVAGGALAGAVSRGGGLGLVGGHLGDPEWLARELPLAAERADGRPWGVGFLAWGVERASLKLALEHRPNAVLLSFGDPAPFADDVRAAGATLIVQVTDAEEARRALDVGADVIVAQGTESGGHGARRGRSTLPFVPYVVDLAGPVPVLAAGGVADGRGLAAALALGAAGAMVGTRFQATAEAIVSPATAQAVLAAHAEDTERGSVLDIARGTRWPRHYTARTLAHPFIDAWRDREPALAADPAARAAYETGVASGELPPEPVWAGESVDLITDRPPAAELVASLAAQARAALTRAAALATGPDDGA